MGMAWREGDRESRRRLREAGSGRPCPSRDRRVTVGKLLADGVALSSLLSSTRVLENCLVPVNGEVSVHHVDERS